MAELILTMRTWQPGLCADLEHLEGSQDIRREVRAGHTASMSSGSTGSWRHGVMGETEPGGLGSSSILREHSLRKIRKILKKAGK